jgi:hypothetical protein
MRRLLPFLLSLGVTACANAPTVLLAAAADTALEDVLAAAREALGGDRVASVTGLSAEGTYRRSLGPREMAGDLELALALPDRYIRVETFSFTGDPGSRMIRSLGFNKDQALDGFTGGGGPGGGMVMRFAGPGGEGASDAERLARLVRVHKMDASRLALALLMRRDAVYPLELAYAGEAEADEGKADVLDAKYQNAAFRLFVDKESHLPLMVSWREPAPRVQSVQRQPGQPPPSQEERERMMREARERAEKEPPKMAEIELFLSDYKEVDGVMLPHTFRRAMDGTVNEEWSIAKYKLNPAFKADVFSKR